MLGMLHVWPSPDDDAQLMRRVQAGETELFERLAVQYRHALYRVARSRLRDDATAEEVVQDTLLSAFRSRHTFRAGFNFRTWLWTILLNRCRRVQNARGRQPQAISWTQIRETHAGPLPSESHDSSPLAGLLQRERSEILETLLARLPEPVADALRLRFFAELKFHEIAQTQGCSLGTAKNRVKSGLLRLSALLRQMGYGGSSASSVASQPSPPPDDAPP
jgi:RNA polymerase sigma-70 factor (ECF subfamily)